jgi:membrane protein required for colicin V production
MSAIDIVLLIIIGFGFVNGLRSGFISELIALISLIIGIFGALKFYAILIPYLKERSISIIATFIIAYFGSQFLLNFIFKSLNLNLGRGTATNSILGAILGTIEMLLFISILAYLLKFNEFYVQLSQKSVVLKSIENYIFPLFNTLFSKDERGAI